MLTIWRLPSCFARKPFADPTAKTAARQQMNLNPTTTQVRNPKQHTFNAVAYQEMMAGAALFGWQNWDGSFGREPRLKPGGPLPRCTGLRETRQKQGENVARESLEITRHEMPP